MSRTLTPKTSLENLRKDAKRWLKALRAGDPAARARLKAAWPKPPADPGLRLPVGTTAVEIDYAGLSLSVPERVRFRTWLEGVDDGWQEAGSRRRAFYANLGWRLDVDLSKGDDFRVVHFTPPGSQCSLLFGHGVTM